MIIIKEHKVLDKSIIMRNSIAFLLFFLSVASSFGQSVYVSKEYSDNIPSFSYYAVSDDPVADYIATYSPSYLFEETKIGESANIEMTVRTFFNYSDNKILSQIVLSVESGQMLRENTRAKVDDAYIWESIDPDEIDSILRFLSSVEPLNVRYDDPMTRVYNTKHGLLLLSRGNDIRIRFPNSPVVRNISARYWIPLFEKAKKAILDISIGRDIFDANTLFFSQPGQSAQTANAQVKGRSVLGSLPKPAYNSQNEGTVVVTVKVDQFGSVTEAIPGAEGTTVTDKKLWNAARAAALKAHFNQSANAPALQDGTITYIFKLK